MLRPGREIPSRAERDFGLAALHEGYRSDGRGMGQMREVAIALGPAAGLAEVTLGRTRVIAVVRAELVQPYPDRPTEGQFSLNVDLSPMASPQFEVGRPSLVAVEMGRLLERAVLKSRAVDVEALCVVPSKHVWSVRCDVTVIDSCGNHVDAAMLAAAAALRHFRKPYVAISYTEGGETVVDVKASDEAEPEPLVLNHMPVSITYALGASPAEGGEAVAIVDPADDEELLCTDKLSVVLNKQGELCALEKAGVVPMPHAQLLECIEQAVALATSLTDMVDDALNRQPPAAARVLRGVRRTG